MHPPRLSQPTAVTPAALELAAELQCIAELGVEAVRLLWRQTFQRSPPAALTRDMLVRMLAHRLQEHRLGGLEPNHRKLLDRLAQGGADDSRRLKIGTVLVREHNDVLHEVVVVPSGFHWHGKTYASLSTIAKGITGTAWNGPRFFGLRANVIVNPNAATDAGEPAPKEQRSRRGRQGAVRARDAGAVATAGPAPALSPSRSPSPPRSPSPSLGDRA